MIISWRSTWIADVRLVRLWLSVLSSWTGESTWVADLRLVYAWLISVVMGLKSVLQMQMLLGEGHTLRSKVHRTIWMRVKLWCRGPWERLLSRMILATMRLMDRMLQVMRRLMVVRPLRIDDLRTRE
jgi:hypothetical protein